MLLPSGRILPQEGTLAQIKSIQQLYLQFTIIFEFYNLNERKNRIKEVIYWTVDLKLQLSYQKSLAERRAKRTLFPRVQLKDSE